MSTPDQDKNTGVLDVVADTPLRLNLTAADIVPPDTFKIGVAVFVDDVSYEVNANFRYRISDEGKLTIYYALVNANAVLEHAIKALVSKISSGTALYAYRGQPIQPITALA